MESNLNKKDITTKTDLKNDYFQEFNQISSNPGSDSKQTNTMNTLSLDIDLSGKEYQAPLNLRSQMRNKINEKLKYYNQSSNNYVNEVMKSELKILAKENAELKFCLNNLNKKFDKEITELKLQNSNKTKELQGTKEIIKKNTALIELLGGKIMNYEKIFKNIEIKNQKKSYLDKNIREKLIQAQKENEELKKELIERDQIIKSYKDEIDTKKEIFEEIDKMKNEMENYLKTMDKLYKEIENKDKEITTLQKNMELMESKHKQEVENIKNNNNIDEINSASNEELMNDLTKSKEKQVELTKELIKMQNMTKEAENDNIKLQEISKEANAIIGNSIEARDKIKSEYDKAIKGLVEKYEKQIQIMKIMIVKQNEEFEARLAELKKGQKTNEGEATDKEKDKEKDNSEEKENEKDEEKIKYLEKLKNDNTMLIKQNLELKNMNEVLLSKMNELPNLNDKFNELFETVKLLKEENDLLKKSLNNNEFYKMLTQEKNNDEKEEEELSDKENNDNKEPDENKDEKENDENNEGDNGEENKKLSLDELQLLENLINEVENGSGGDKELNEQKLELLENILKRMENKNENEKSEKHEEEEEEEEKNKEEVNAKDTKDDKNEKNNIQNEELLKDKTNDINKTSKIYNKKHLKSSPKIIQKENGEKIKTEEGNDEEEENEEEETTPNQINENFYLYKPKKEGMLSFSLSKKNYSSTIPNKYDEFLKVFDPETSVQYNTLEGLFIIPSDKCNKLYYYSSKKNTITELFTLKENHSGGCLFLDNLSKNIIALGGSESKAVEKFSFETGNLIQLPELPTHRSQITCNQIENKIYCFFGNSKEVPDKSIIEYLDLNNLEQGWKEVEYANEAGFNVISGMSSINLNDNELLIIGGLLDNKEPNEKLLYFNIENKKLIKLDKNLPDSDDKIYLFTQNSVFNLFVNGEIISFANIDNNNQVHILDNDLCYDLYLTPKEPIK